MGTAPERLTGVVSARSCIRASKNTPSLPPTPVLFTDWESTIAALGFRYLPSRRGRRRRRLRRSVAARYRRCATSRTSRRPSLRAGSPSAATAKDNRSLARRRRRLGSAASREAWDELVRSVREDAPVQRRVRCLLAAGPSWFFAGRGGDGLDRLLALGRAYRPLRVPCVAVPR